MIKAEELKEIFDLFEALGGPRFYWEHELGRHPYEVNPQWKAVCPDSRWESGPDYTEDLDMDRIGIGHRHGSGKVAFVPCLRMRIDDPEWGMVTFSDECQTICIQTQHFVVSSLTA